MEIRVVESKKDFKEFLSLPEKLFQKDINWVPKLDMDIKHLLGDSNPYYEHAWKKLFIAYKDGKPVGRIAAIIDYNFIDFHKQKTGYFGFFECIDDIEAAKALFNSCEEALKDKGMENIMGPMNPSSNDECGMLVEGFNAPPRFMMPYNPRYYIGLLGVAGYGKAKDLLALNMKVSEGDHSKLEKFVNKITKRSPEMSTRPIKMKEFKTEVEHIKDIYNSAWEKNWGFVPWTDAELNDVAKNLKALVVEDLVQMGCSEDKPIAFLMALPDYNEIIKKIGRSLLPLGWLKFIMLKKNIKNLRLLAMGVSKDYQNKGIGALMYYNALQVARSRGFAECEFSWILEDNIETLRIGQLMGAEVYKKYRIYQKNL